MVAELQPLFIGGVPTAGRGVAMKSVNPANGEITAHYSTATAEDVSAAIAAAGKAAFDPAWRYMLPHRRAILLQDIAARIDNAQETLARLQMRENGKTITECRAQAKTCAAVFRYYASVCETQESEVTTPRGHYVSLVVHEPFGIVGLITPWNSPLTMEAQKLAPALAAGNAVLLKPSEVTPGIGLELGNLCSEAGVPDGVVNVLSGSGAAVGDAIVRHPNVRMVAFTGGTETGRAIARAAAEKLMPVALELGGKSPNIVFADADLNNACDAVANGIFGSMGQSCVAGSRLFVERSVYGQVVEAIVARAQAYRIGPPNDAMTDLGPLASFVHRHRVEALVQSGRSEGGRVLCGGARPTGLDQGAYYLPTVIDGLEATARLCREEVFGPVLVALPFDGEDDLARQANNTNYGLACGVWTADHKRAWRVARQIEAGTVWINSYKTLSISSPFGGFKESGIGREKGRQGLHLFQESKSIYMPF